MKNVCWLSLSTQFGRGWLGTGAAAALVLSVSSVAMSAEILLPEVTEPEVFEPVADSPFAGFYVGVHAGYSWADASFFGAPYVANLPNENLSLLGRNDSFGPDGGLFGVQGGYNFISQGNLLFGIEGDWTNLGAKDRVSNSQTILVNNEAFVFNSTSELELNWQASVRGRIGVVQDDTLFFGTAGVAFLDMDWRETATAFDEDANETYVQTHRGGDTLTGLALGGGVEFAVSENAIFGAEYLYENFGGSGGLPFGHSTPPQMGQINDLEMHKVRLRLSFKLGGGN